MDLKIITQAKLDKFLPLAIKNNWSVTKLAKETGCHYDTAKKKIIEATGVLGKKDEIDVKRLYEDMEQEAFLRRESALKKLKRLENVLESALKQEEKTKTKDVKELKSLVSTFKQYWGLVTDVTGVKFIEKVRTAEAGASKMQLNMNGIDPNAIKSVNTIENEA